MNKMKLAALVFVIIGSSLCVNAQSNLTNELVWFDKWINDELLTAIKEAGEVDAWIKDPFKGDDRDLLAQQQRMIIEQFSQFIARNPKNPGFYYVRGLVYKALGQNILAIRDYKHIFELDPAARLDVRLHVDIGEAIRDSGGNYVSSELPFLNEAISRFPDKPLFYLLRGIAKFFDADDESALNDYNRAIDLSPGDHTKYLTYLARGILYFRSLVKFDGPKGFSDFEAAIKIAEGNSDRTSHILGVLTGTIDSDLVPPEAYHLRGIMFQNDKRFLEASNDYSKAIKLQPGKSELYYRRGISNHSLKNFAVALEDFSKAISLGFKNAELFNLRGDIYYDKKSYDLAIADYSKAIEMDPKKALYFLNRGATFQNKSNTDLAIADFTSAIKLDPADAGSYLGRGQAYKLKGEKDLAVANLTKAIELKPNWIESFNVRGETYREQGKYDLAISDHTRAIEISKNSNAYAFVLRSLAHNEKGDGKSALKDINRAIELDAKIWWHFRNRGNIYRDSEKRLDLAIADYDKAIALEPNEYSNFVNRGIAHRQSNKLDLAIADYNKAVQIDPKNFTAYRTRCYAHAKNGNFELAILDCNKAVQLAVNMVPALQSGTHSTRGEVYQMFDKLDLAIADYRKALSINPGDLNAKKMLSDMGLAP